MSCDLQALEPSNNEPVNPIEPHRSILATTQKTSTTDNKLRKASNLAQDDSMNEAEKENLSAVSDCMLYIHIFFPFLNGEIGAIDIKMNRFSSNVFSATKSKHERKCKTPIMGKLLCYLGVS